MSKIEIGNARVMFITPNQQFGVAECYDKSYPVCINYRRRVENEPRFKGGFLAVIGMPEGEDHTKMI